MRNMPILPMRNVYVLVYYNVGLSFSLVVTLVAVACWLYCDEMLGIVYRWVCRICLQVLNIRDRFIIIIVMPLISLLWKVSISITRRFIMFHNYIHSWYGELQQKLRMKLTIIDFIIIIPWWRGRIKDLRRVKSHCKFLTDNRTLCALLYIIKLIALLLI